MAGRRGRHARGLRPRALRGDALSTPTAADRAARGGAGRIAAYAAGVVLVALASVLLLRHLGVVDFGRYATVIALAAIVGGLADAGLTVVGQREYVALEDAAERRRLVGAVAGVRLVLAPLGILVAAGFCLAVGYPGEMVTGMLVAGAGVVCSSAAVSLALPLSAELRLGRVALAELARQVALTLSIALFVAFDADLGTFFAAQLIAGAAMLAVTLRLAGGAAAPSVGRDAWVLLREAAPIAASLVDNVI